MITPVMSCARKRKYHIIHDIPGNNDVPRLESYQKTGVNLTDFEEEVVGP